MLRVPLKKGDFYEIHLSYWLALIQSTCNSDRQTELYIIYANINCTISLQEWHFLTPLGHIKNSSSIETEQHHLCRVLHFNCQNLMLISPPNDQASVGQLFLTYGLFYKNEATSGTLPTK